MPSSQGVTHSGQNEGRGHSAAARSRRRTGDARLSTPNQLPYLLSMYAEELGPPMPTEQKMFPFVLTQPMLRPPGSFHCVPSSKVTDAFEICFQGVKLPLGVNRNRVQVWLVYRQDALAPGLMFAQ